MTKVFGRRDCTPFNSVSESINLKLRGSHYTCNIDGRILKMTAFIQAVPSTRTQTSTFKLSMAIYEHVSDTDAGVKLAQTNTATWTQNQGVIYIGEKSIAFKNQQPILKAHTKYFLLAQGYCSRGASLYLYRRTTEETNKGIYKNLGIIPYFPLWQSPLAGEASVNHIYCINCTFVQDTTAGKQYTSWTP